METHVIIMAGGIGSRFWPMSTPSHPKQFVDVLGCGKTMIQLTAERLEPICPVENMWIVTSEKYVKEVMHSLPLIPDSNILAEPEARNTAPCIAYASWKIAREHPDANIIVCPSDAFIQDDEAYRAVLERALRFTAQTPSIVTVGIRPVRPETGYGYILASEGDDDILKVSSFKEKPSLEVAREYLADGHYLWNAGIFVWNVRTIVDSIRRYAPQIAEVMDRISGSFFTDAEPEMLRDWFPRCDKISIDYAVMEKSPDIYTIPGDFGWSDVGTWGSLLELSDRDGDSNAVISQNADVSFYETRGCIVHTSGLKKIVLQGLEDYIVAENDGSLLICKISEEQRIKDFQK